MLLKHLDDVLILTGCGAIAYGSYLVNPLLVWFVAGVELIALGVLVGLGGKRDHT